MDIVPVYEAPPNLVLDYLERRGMPADLIRWKYFDSQVPDVHRGFVLIEGTHAVGFIGLVPGVFQVGQERTLIYWTCDWSVREGIRGNYGLKLLEMARRGSTPVFALGGADATQKILARIARHYLKDAALVFRRSVSVGGALQALKRRGVLPLNLEGTILYRIPLPFLPSVCGHVETTRRLSATSLVAWGASTPHSFTPLHEKHELEWRMERCPGLNSWSIDSPSGTAALAWRMQGVPAEWKLAVRPAKRIIQEISDCVAGSLRLISMEGGGSVNALVSAADKELISVLRRSGFRQINVPYPLADLTASHISRVAEAPTGLSYLDSDIHYRF